MSKQVREGKLQLIVADEKKPAVKLKPGMKLEVVSVSLIGAGAARLRKKRGSRLCGGTSTCLALVQIEKGDPF